MLLHPFYINFIPLAYLIKKLLAISNFFKHQPAVCLSTLCIKKMKFAKFVYNYEVEKVRKKNRERVQIYI